MRERNKKVSPHGGRKGGNKRKEQCGEICGGQKNDVGGLWPQQQKETGSLGGR